MKGSGTAADPYIITTLTDLQNVKNDLVAYYELGNSIDASSTSGWNGGAGFEPIGTSIAPFQGHFDGKGYSVSGLYINRPTTDRVGLFGCVEADSTYTSVTISNVHMSEIDITGDDKVGGLIGELRDDTVGVVVVSGCSTAGNVSGQNDIGGFVGYAVPNLDSTSSISGCSSSCDVTGVASSADVGGFVGELGYMTISQCYASGSVSGEDNIGGFAGYIGNYGSCARSYATGSVTATNDYVGGFVGRSGLGTISNCYAKGNVEGDGSADGSSDGAGGFVGNASLGSFEYCYSTGAPQADTNVGGFAGKDADSGNSTFSHCLWDTESSGQSEASGDGDINGITGYDTDEMKSKATIRSEQWSLSIWNVLSSCNDGYPCLIGVNSCCFAYVPLGDPTIAKTRPSLELIRNIEVQCDGRCFVDKHGNFRYESRFTRSG